MKVCPKCGTRYTDASLQYCLQDGARLDVAADPSSITTAEEPETIVRQRESGKAVPRASHGPRTGLIIALTALLTAALLIIAGIAAWLILRDNSETAKADTNKSANTVLTADRTPSLVPTPAANANANAANKPANSTNDPGDEAKARREVTEFIGNWKSATESKDINAYMGQYADTIAYYNNPSASRDEVRNDKRRAFSLYDHIRMDISNIDTSVHSDGNSAVTTFDKEWEFIGSSESRGKVRSELRLRKIDGKWKIVGERDQKVYYVK